MPRVKKPSIPAKILAQSITSTATSFKLNNILDWNGVALTSSAFGDYAWGTFRNATNTQVEYFRFDPSTIASASITIVKRGLDYLGADYDSEITLNKYSWSANETIVELGTNPPGFYDQFAAKYNAETIGAVWTFGNTTRPKLDSDVDATDNSELITQGQLNRTALGTVTSANVFIAGTAGETLASGNIVYLKASDGRWWKASAATAATCEGVQLGVARGAGTAGNSVSGGILIKGIDSNRSSLTVGAIQYLSDTSGAVSSTPGTLTISLGNAKSTTELYFNPRYLEIPNGGQKAALSGSSGTPGSGNKYVTENDVATNTASKIVRRGSDNKVAGTVSVGGTGVDGALSISSGTTTIDCAGASYVTKNYTSISITGTGKLAFSNPNSAGTIIVLKSQGDVTITSSTVPAIDVTNMGPAGGTGGTSVSGVNDGNNGVDGANNYIQFSKLLTSTNSTKGIKGGQGRDSTNLGAAGTASTILSLEYPSEDFPTIATYLLLKGQTGASGGGGGSGRAGAGGSSSGAGGTGGQAGGTLLILCNGNWNFTGNISVAGSAGTAGSTGSGGDRGGSGGGGGGAAGIFIARVGGITANTGTVNISGGNGGNGSAGTGATANNGGGGGGSGGANSISAGGAGGVGGYDSAHPSTNGTTPPSGGTGGTLGGGNTGTMGSGATSGGGGGGGGGAVGYSSISVI